MNVWNTLLHGRLAAPTLIAPNRNGSMADTGSGDTPTFPSRAMEQVDHRPWPVPSRPWRMFMRWEDLLFLHWPVEPDQIRRLVPGSLELDLFDGRAWVAVTPLRMSGVRHRIMPPVPGMSSFPELNVRTYVRAGGKAGVWFFSLDAANPLAVWGARLTYCLPYYSARMSADWANGFLEYRSHREIRGEPPAEFRARYRPAGDVFHASPGSLDHWAIERYCLYAADRQGRTCRADIHHAPWPLQAAEAHVACNTMTAPLGLSLSGDPMLHFAGRLDVVAWRSCPTDAD